VSSLRSYIRLLLLERDENLSGIDQVLNEPKREKVPASKLNLFPNEGYHNILAVLKKATGTEIDYWSNWYFHASNHVSQLAQEYDIPLPVAAAVCAVLSPNLNWKLNLLAAKRTMDNWMHMGGQKDYPYWDKIPAYKTNVNKALEILKTGDTGIVNGPKVTVFFQSLLNPDEVKRDLVLDGHAINVWRGIKTSLQNVGQPNKAERAAIIQDYRKVAEITGLTPQGVQAVTWFIWKYVTNPPKSPTKKYRVEQPAVKNEVAGRKRLANLIRESVRDILGQ